MGADVSRQGAVANAMIRVDQLMSCSTCEGSARQLNAFHKSSMEIQMSFPIAKTAAIGAAVGETAGSRRPERATVIGIRSADSIKASGRQHRVDRPYT